MCIGAFVVAVQAGPQSPCKGAAQESLLRRRIRHRNGNRERRHQRRVGETQPNRLELRVLRRRRRWKAGLAARGRHRASSRDGCLVPGSPWSSSTTPKRLDWGPFLRIGFWDRAGFWGKVRASFSDVLQAGGECNPVWVNSMGVSSRPCRRRSSRDRHGQPIRPSAPAWSSQCHPSMRPDDPIRNHGATIIPPVRPETGHVGQHSAKPPRLLDRVRDRQKRDHIRHHDWKPRHQEHVERRPT